ncbi:MAG: EamA family transporter [Desulfobacteraceae bacterium 4484_190.2]|nr:MAG: EamA family transporter [Desulfobacteraceae bacterium 4484_190.2]
MFVYIKLFLTAVFWGGTFIAGRVVAKDVGPFAASFLRFAIASVFLLFITWRVDRKLPALKRAQIIPVILLGMTGVFAYNVLFFKGLKIIEAGRASLIIANNPIFITLFASYFFKEKLNPIKVTGIIISVIGAIIVISRGNPIELLNGNVGWGELYIFCCVLTWVAYTLIGKAIMTELSPIVSVSYSSAVGAVALFVPAYFEGMMRDLVHYSTADWFGIFYLGFFGTVLGFVWYYQGIKIIGPMKASQFLNFVPISAVLLAFFMLGESITLSLLVGTIFVISGVYLTNRADA